MLIFVEIQPMKSQPDGRTIHGAKLAIEKYHNRTMPNTNSMETMNRV